MNVRFFINNECCERQNIAAGRKTREFFSEKINNVSDWEDVIFVRGHIDDKKDGGIEWELCEAMGVNPAKYVGRLDFFEFFIFKTRGVADTYEVCVNVRKAV